VFFGNVLCYFPYLYLVLFQKDTLRSEKKKARAKGLKLQYNKLCFVLPAVFDLLSSTLNFIGLTMATASAAQLMSSANILCTAILSYFFLKRRYTGLQIIGVLLLIIGIVIIGTASVMGTEDKVQSY